MSVLIKGMKMPKNCFSCPLGTDYGTCGYYAHCTKEERDVAIEGRRVDCPLIPVPPHGRLIDADEADSRYIPDFTDLTDYQQGWNDAMKRVCDNAPTIIEAEEDEECTKT